jgi:c-di-GMP-related signal transduction protein
MPNLFDKPLVDVFIARQAILDRDERLFAYELLYRKCRQNRAEIVDDSASTLQVLSTTLLSSGLPTLCGNTPVFVNFGRDMLMTNWTSLFPASAIVIEILESVEGDPEVIAACVELKRKGYALALDDVTEKSDPEFVKLADIVKIDFRSTGPESQARLARAYKGSGRRLLAEKVETLEEFERAKKLGFEYFQGFFFSKPVVFEGHQVPVLKGTAMQLLMKLQSADLDFSLLEDLIKCDVSLTYKLLRYVNSALFARAKPITGIRDALIAMGEIDIRRWIILATLLDLSADNSRVLVVHALVRARFCETLAVAAGEPLPSNVFLMGMFSLLDALAHRPLPELLQELSLPPEIVRPLLNLEERSQMAAILRLTKCYEAGEWDEVDEYGKLLRLPDDAIADLYVAAVNWAAQMIDVAGIFPVGGRRFKMGGRVKVKDTESGDDLRAIQRALVSPSGGKTRAAT